MSTVEVTWAVRHEYSKTFEDSELPELRSALELDEDATASEIFDALTEEDEKTARALDGWTDDRTWQTSDDEFEIRGGIGRDN